MLPEVAAVRVVALLAAHALHKVEHKVDVVALVCPPQILAVVAARTCTRIRVSTITWLQSRVLGIIIVYMSRNESLVARVMAQRHVHIACPNHTSSYCYWGQLAIRCLA